GMVETSDEWIRGRSGIGARRIAAPDETAATLGLAAAREALAVAQVDPADLDLIVVGTSTPDHYAYPSTACLIQAALGAERAGGSRAPASQATVEQRQHYIRMDGPEVYRFSTLIVPAVVERMCASAAIAPSAIDLLIPHQANSRIIQGAARRLALQEGAVFVN